MNATFVPQKVRISVERYQQMVSAGILTKHDRIELIEGEMVEMAPMGQPHAALTTRLNRMLVLALGETAVLSPGGPVNMGDYSEPQPDIVLLRPRADDYFGKIPDAADVLLLIEISDSSLAYDCGIKRALYARYDIAEYWVVDVANRRILVNRHPQAGSFATTLEFGTSDEISPLALPQVRINIRALFA